EALRGGGVGQIANLTCDKGGGQIGNLSYDGFVCGRTFDDLLTVGLSRGERISRNHESTRGGVNADVAVFKMKFVEERRDTGCEIRVGGVYVGGGEFFGSDFQNKG